KLAQAEQSSQEYKAKVDELGDKIDQLRIVKGKLEATEKLLEEKELRRQQVGAELESIRGQLEQKEQKIEELSAEADAEKSKMKEELDKYRQQLQQSQPNSTTDGAIQELESKIETLKAKNREKINKISELEKLMVSKDSEIIELSKAKSELENEIEE